MKKYQVCSSPDCGYKFNLPHRRHCKICGETLISLRTKQQERVDSNKSILKVNKKANKNKRNILVAVMLTSLAGTGLYYLNKPIVNLKAETPAQELPTGLLRFWGPPCSEKLMFKLIAKELNQKTDFRAILTDIDSRDALEELIDGQISLVLHEKSQFPHHQAKAEKAGVKLEGIPYALDGVAYIVNQKVEGVPYLTIEQLEKIYRGEITNWQDVGGPKLIIRPILLSGLGRNSLFLNFQGQLNPNMIYTDNRKKAITDLHDNPGALFYTSATLAAEEKNVKIIPLQNKHGDIVPPVIDGKPNQKAFVPPVIDGKPNQKALLEAPYPQLRTLFAIKVVTKKRPEHKIVDSYINFLISPEGQSIVKYRGFVPLYIPL